MAELILKFTDESGARREVAVTRERFSIGRTPDNELPIASGALSRKHAEIQRFGDVFMISDCGSSNGTVLNQRELSQPAALKDGDRILLGGAVEITVELEAEVYVPVAGQKTNSIHPAVSGEAAPFWQNLYFVAPVLGVTVLLLIGVLVFALRSGGREKPVIAEDNREVSEDLPEDDEGNRRTSSRNRNAVAANNNENDESSPPPANRRSAENLNENGNSGVATKVDSNSSGTSSGEDEKVEALALQFLRRISDNQNPVLNSKQIAVIKTKINALKNSAAFRDNLRAANKNIASFAKTGETHNLKAMFLAAAALAKLNDSRGDAAATAAAIAPDLQKYALVLGTELANDNLLAIAAYAEGDPPNAMRDRVANLTLAPGTTATAVRSIWFLRENGKLSEGAFDFAVRFVATGTLLQNPAAFNL